MSQQNNTEGVVLAFIFAGVGLFALAMLVFVCAAAIVLTIFFTGASLMAWNKPVTMGQLTIEPDEARLFICRGLVGAVLVPGFVGACVLIVGTSIDVQAFFYLALGGYVGGSIGIEWLLSQIEQEAEPTAPVMPPPAPVWEPPRRIPDQRPPFQYASWDDEDAGQ